MVKVIDNSHVDQALGGVCVKILTSLLQWG